MRRGPLLVAISLVVATALGAQDRRDSLITRAKEQFDPGQRIQLLVTALDPAYGPPRGLWGDGVQRLAQTLIDDGRDSAAAVWLRWALRRFPALQPDTIEFPPPVTAALQAARQFVNGTASPGDSVTGETWRWPAATDFRTPSRILVDSATAIPLRVSVDGGAALGPGGSTQVAPGSHEVRATAMGYDSVRVTREAIPGTTLVLHFTLHSLLRQVVTGQQKTQPPLSAAPHKHFPWALAALGAVGAGAAVVLLAGKKSNPPPPTTGGIIITFPNP